MMKTIEVMSREQAEVFSPDRTTAVISISCPGDPPVVFPPQVHALHLVFADISRAQYDKYRNSPTLSKVMVCFSRAQARQILDFVDAQLKAGVEHFMVHCAAGLSRSPGVALALSGIYMGVKEVRPGWNLYNSTVYQTIMREYHWVPESDPV